MGMCMVPYAHNEAKLLFVPPSSHETNIEIKTGKKNVKTNMIPSLPSQSGMPIICHKSKPARISSMTEHAPNTKQSHVIK